MNIRTISDDEGFLSLKSDWERLSENLAVVTRFDWIYRWWKHFQKDNELNIIVVEENNKVVGIAPLYLEFSRALKFIPFKSLAFLGGDVSDLLDFLIDKENRELIFKTLFDYIMRNVPYDLLSLGQINSGYPNFDLWKKYSKLFNLEFTPFKENHRINLSEFASYEDFYNKLNKNLKRSLKYRQNKIKKDNANIKYLFKSNITEEEMQITAALNIKRQKQLYKQGNHKRDSYFADECKGNFIKEYFCEGDTDKKMLVSMNCGNEIIAYFLVLVYNNTLALWNCGFNPDYQGYCPSKMLINEIVKYAFSNNCKCIDFLRGDEHYKLQWTNETEINHTLMNNKSSLAQIVHLYRKFTPYFLLMKLRNKNIKMLEYDESQFMEI